MIIFEMSDMLVLKSFKDQNEHVEETKLSDWNLLFWDCIAIWEQTNERDNH